MKKVTHAAQQKAWDDEHKKPNVLKQMDSDEASSGVERFFTYLEQKNISREKGLEMGCGKGRNVIWLAKQGVAMTGFDFSPAAIKEAKRRSKSSNAASAHFVVADATKKWPFKNNSFDFGIDCFASTDIESVSGRKKAISEMRRVLKPGGYFFAYLLSIDDAFHKEMISKSPVSERNAFVHATGKFEKTYDNKEVKDLFKDFDLIKKDRISKIAHFFGKKYPCKHFWLVFRKPH